MNIPQNINGQGTMANSSPVVIASDQTALAIKTLELSGSGAATNALIIAATDVTQYKWMSVQIGNIGINSVVIEGSNDNTVWVELPTNSTDGLQTIDPGEAIVANGIYVTPVMTKWMRVRISSYGFGGSITANAIFSSQTANPYLTTIKASGPLPISSASPLAVTKSGTWNVGIDQTTPGTTNGIQITALTYPQSLSNNSVAQLASGATFTGGIETVLSLQAAQVMITCDQPYSVFIDQFIDLAGTKLVATYTFTRLAGEPLNENVTLPGNYFRVRVTNTGASTTTTFRLDTTFGIMNTQPNTLSNYGNLKVVAQENGVPSVINSTSTNLAGGATFTGTAEDVSEFSTVMVSVYSSHASATDGLSVQFSSNGTNWDLMDVFTIPATTGKSFSFGVVARYYRLVYTNGATLTTSLRIQTLYSRTTKKSSSQRPSDGRTNENDFEEMNAYNSVFNGTTWDRVRGDVTNGMDVDVTRLPALVAGTAQIGTVGITAQTTGGYIPYHLVSAASTNLVNIKASAGQVFGWYIYNSNAAARKVAFHNTAGTPTAGASVFFSLVIPPTSGANVFNDTGIAFSTGIAISTVTGLADNDTAAVALNDLVINIFYK